MNFGGLSGMSATPGGYQTGRRDIMQNDNTEIQQMGLAALGRALAYQPPQGPQPPAPGEASTPAPQGPQMQAPMPPPRPEAIGGAPPMQVAPQGPPGGQELPPGQPSMPQQPPVPKQAPAPQQQGGLGSPGTMDPIAQRIAAANPGAPPAVLAAAYQQYIQHMRRSYGLPQQMQLRQQAQDLRAKELGLREQGMNAPPPQALQSLREGHITTFTNGQSWTIQGGKPVRVDKRSDAGDEAELPPGATLTAGRVPEAMPFFKDDKERQDAIRRGGVADQKPPGRLSPTHKGEDAFPPTEEAFTKKFGREPATDSEVEFYELQKLNAKRKEYNLKPLKALPPDYGMSGENRNLLNPDNDTPELESGSVPDKRSFEHLLEMNRRERQPRL